ncbi:MAG: IS1380 family transposase [Actinomycetales bacterium]|nr:IS1380 family transposase [Actinomycetales bacterium]
MKHSTRSYPLIHVDTARSGAVGQAGGVLLTRAAEITGLTAGLRAGLGRWRKPLAVHDPGKVVSDLALSLAVGGDCLADLATLRSEPGVYGHVASPATVSRTMSALAGDTRAALRAINQARATAREQAWALAGTDSPGHGACATDPLIVDIDATLVIAHSEKEHAAPTFKKSFGFHPLLAFCDHGPSGTGEPLAVLLRAGNAGSNTATDHITLTRDALAQLPGVNPSRPGKKILVRTDGAGGTKKFTRWLTRRRAQYSVGFTLPGHTPGLLKKIPQQVWAPAYDADGQVRPGADVAELTDLLDLTEWPPGMRVIARRERPHPGAQLRFDDVEGYRITAFATNTTKGQLADLELRHRRRARCEDRIRIAKDTGLTNLPLHGFDQNALWCHLVLMAAELTTWTQLLAFAGHPARRWEPKRLRHRIFTVPATLARTGRRVILHLKEDAPWAGLVMNGWTALTALAPP